MPARAKRNKHKWHCSNSAPKRVLTSKAPEKSKRRNGSEGYLLRDDKLGSSRFLSKQHGSAHPVLQRALTLRRVRSLAVVRNAILR